MKFKIHQHITSRARDRFEAVDELVAASGGPPGQLPLSDFGLYKCETCGKMVMGYEKENNMQEKHSGKSVEWKKVR